MSGAAIARQLLIARSQLTALVPAARIMAGVIPQNTALPCISIMEVSGVDRQTLKGQPAVKVTDRVQITVMATDYVSCKQVMAQARKACRDYVGNIGNWQAITCHLDIKGPDFMSEAGYCAQSQDLRITFSE